MRRMVELSLVLCLAGCTGVSPGTGTSATSQALAASGPVGASIAEAATEAGVPAELLMAIAIEEQGVHLPSMRLSPDGQINIAGRLELRHGRLDTLAMGARLLGVTEAELQADTDLGTRAGALVVAELGARYGAGSDLESWRPALEALAGMDDLNAHNYASRVLAILRDGGSFPAWAGETVQLAPHAEIARAETVQVARASAAAVPDYPSAIWVPTTCADKCTTGRPLGNGSVDKIVIHDTEGGWDASLSTLQNKTGVSVHYLVDADGSRVAQFRHETDTTWHAGNYFYNETSIGIEHVGFVADPGFQSGLYATSKDLVESIRSRWDVPLDRTHIVGHYQIPDPNDLGQQAAPCTDTLDACETSPNYGGAARHTDPGYHWQWCQYMESLGGTCTCNDAWSLWNCTTDGVEAWRCTDGEVQKQDCVDGCDVMPIGTDDFCHVAIESPEPDAGPGTTDPGDPDAGTGTIDPGGADAGPGPTGPGANSGQLEGGCQAATGSGRRAGGLAWLLLGSLALVACRRRARG
ncbi:MAG TPA: N-acetylmuramoyl-L-alanine amidase [Kofleriaceae bacterium]|nr:N-acetylmuramoyl-L-alanine amidase [Kofleriaceae bacterium]